MDLVLATADGSGLPWGPPVFFAADGHQQDFWVSSPDSRRWRTGDPPDFVLVRGGDQRFGTGTAARVEVGPEMSHPSGSVSNHEH
ncbi:hypothetical protein [Actinoplanes sp. N902-109]|uniref:hypothetical protein n=1 Tax=Actinoplanes sp. (strain N902-109) TaxID=649831 RepID=UPI0003295021|nr:hypothetical protein [Actinoplanes sp. N902-109]AGL18456.1 hypothetical protein L083_4946 [Actinoplanes sp. N902-109]